MLQSGKCCAFTGLAAFAASPEGIRRLPVSKLPASVGFLPVALLRVTLPCLRLALGRAAARARRPPPRRDGMIITGGARALCLRLFYGRSV